MEFEDSRLSNISNFCAASSLVLGGVLENLKGEDSIAAISRRKALAIGKTGERHDGDIFDKSKYGFPSMMPATAMRR